MPKPCAVCSHPSRSEIDRQLSQQAINVSALARHYGLKRDSVMNHRSKHLPDFLPAFEATASAPAGGEVNAETQRLYALALDALATAQAGVLVQVGKTDAKTGERHFERIVSPTSIVKAIGEARKILGMISALAAAPRKEQATADSMGTALESAMSRALARFEERVGGQQPALGMSHDDAYVDAEVIVTPTHTSGESVSVGQTQRGEQVFGFESVRLDSGHAEPTTPGPGAGSGPPLVSASAGAPNPDGPPKIPVDAENPDDPSLRAADLFLASVPPEVRAHIADVLAQHAGNDQLNPERIERPWPGNPGASLEERRAAGWPDPVSAVEANPATQAQAHRAEVAETEVRAELGLPPRQRRRSSPAPADPARRSKQ